MKRIIFVLFTIILSACSLLSSNTDDTTWKVEKNEDCADFTTIKVFQTLDNGALAHVCNNSWNTEYCSGMVVFVMKQWDMKLWDERVLTVPQDKCFTYDGTYKYETKGKDVKTVPMLGLGYKYSPKSEEDAQTRLLTRSIDFYKNCQLNFANEKDKTLKSEGDKLCSCLEKASENLFKQNDNDVDILDSSVEYLSKVLECSKKYPKAAKAY